MPGESFRSKLVVNQPFVGNEMLQQNLVISRKLLVFLKYTPMSFSDQVVKLKL